MMAYSMSDELDELQELHYRRQLMQEPRINPLPSLMLQSARDLNVACRP
jgi:hypothetical protein